MPAFTIQDAARHARLGYLHAKAALWDARARGDAAAEAEAAERVVDAYDCMERER